MRSSRLSACVLLLAAGCAADPPPQSAPAPVAPLAPAPPPPPGTGRQEWSAFIGGFGDTQGPEGTVMAVVHDWGTVALVRIRRLPADGTLPWHVHEGTCETRGAPVVGPLASYAPLRPVAGEAAEGEAVLGRAWLAPDRAYAIDVHRAPGDTGPPLACVNLVLRT
jgi:hypothetical protein